MERFGEIMKEEFVKEIRIKEKSDKEKRIDLIRSIIIAKSELKQAIHSFEYAEGDLIDYYSYKIKAEQAKLDYLLKKVKEEKIVLDMINAISSSWAV